MFLVINAGSSSLKFKLFDSGLREIAGGLVERIGLKDSFLEWNYDGQTWRSDWASGMPNHERAFLEVFDSLKSVGLHLEEITAVGHRVVHGAETFVEPVRLTPAVAKRLKSISHMAPLHNPANISAYEACAKLLPKAKHVACFDTGFHSTLPDHAFIYSLPWELYQKHRIRKYGFHGLSHEYVSEQAAKLLKRPLSKLKLVSCHLGSGASVAAIRNGKSVETTMGFTPLEGLTMTTRCGDIDPAIPLYLMRQLKMKPDEVDVLMNKQSGLLGLSGYKDMRDVLSIIGVKVPGYEFKEKVSQETKRRAKIAFEAFCYDVARYIAQFTCLMGGADAIIFTAGIGERSEPVRKRIMEIVTLPGKPKVLVIPTNEELNIVRKTRKLVG